MTNGMVFDTHGFILKKIQWHIHAGSWSLVNCWWEPLTRHYIRCSWILMHAAVGLMDGLGLDGDRCIRVIPRHWSMKISWQGDIRVVKMKLRQSLFWVIRDKTVTSINCGTGSKSTTPLWPYKICMLMFTTYSSVAVLFSTCMGIGVCSDNVFPIPHIQ